MKRKHMRKIKESLKRAGIKKLERMIAFILAICIINTTVDWSVFSNVYAIQQDEMCENHPTHDEECGFVQAKEASPCLHVHDDTCYEETKACVHNHTEDCVSEEDAGSGEDAALEEGAVSEEEGASEENTVPKAAACNHVCSEETGCITKILSCQHQHDESCGYAEAVEGQPCNHICEACSQENLIAPLSEGEENQPESPQPIEYEKLEGYTFDITIPLELSGELKSNYDKVQNVPDEDFKSLITNLVTGIKVYANDNEIQEEDFKRKIDGENGIITGIPVYIEKGTGSMANGGSGKFEITPNFYSIEIPNQLGDSRMYNLAFENGFHSAAITVERLESEPVWYGTSSKILISQRPVKKYSYNVTIHGINTVEDFKNKLSGMRLEYTEGTAINTIANPEITANGNDSFTVTYSNIPTSGTIDSSVEIYIPKPADYVIYKNKEICKEESFNPNACQINNHVHTQGGCSTKVEFQYIKKTTLTGSMIWMDSGFDNAITDIRIPEETIKEKLEVYKVSSSNNQEGIKLDSTEYNLELTGTDNTSNKWDITITGLPSYDVDGAAIFYYYKWNVENNQFDKNIADQHYYYRLSYSNADNTVETDKAYDGCTIYMVLTKDNASNSINIIWKDDQYNNRDNEARNEEIGSGIQLYLWRGTSTNFSNAAAVYDEKGNQYSCKLGITHTVDTVNINESDMGLGDSTLPHYNENGKKYYYFITAVDGGNNYKVEYEDEKTYASGNDGKIYFTRVGVDNKKVTVDWKKAAGETDYIGTKAVLQLQRRLKGSGQSQWEDVPDGQATTSKATANNKSLTNYFYNVDQFNEDGRTYEFRVIETALISPSGGSTEITNWQTNSGETEKAEVSFTYSDHGYQAYAHYMETDANGRNIYKVENCLSSDMDYLVNVQWRFDGAADFEVDAYKELLQRKLNANEEVWANGEIRLQPITYKISQQKTGSSKDPDYATITVTGYDKDTKKITYTLQITGQGTQTLTGTVEEINNYQQWKFEGIRFPKYDENGYKYTYVLEGESSAAGEHTDIVNKYKEVTNGKELNLYLDRSSETLANGSRITIIHYPTSSHQSTYSIHIEVKWEDNVTDIGRRESCADVIALAKIDDEYYYVDKINTNPIVLNQTNNFQKTCYFSPISDAKLAEYNTANGTAFTQSDIIYTAVQTQFGYNGTTYQIPYYDIGTKKVNEAYLFADKGSITTPLLFKTGDEQNIKLYSYDTKTTTAEGGYCQAGPTSIKSATKVFKNSIMNLFTDIDVTVNWKDSSNISGYRKDQLKVKLYRSAKGVEEVVKDDDGNNLEIVWNTPDSINNSYVDAATFRNLPLYDADGNGYSYYIRQYIVDSSKNTETLIDETATANTTKTFYTMTMDSENIASVTNPTDKDGNISEVAARNYHNKITITVNNTAANEAYQTEFYVIWHDEAAYTEKKRADVNYTLYYALDGNGEKKPYDLSKYNCVIKTAETGILSGIISNPYYQKAEYSNLLEYTADGQKIHYYLKVEKVDNEKSYFKYQMEYYPIKDKNKYTTEPELKVTEQNSLYKHRYFDNTVHPVIAVNEESQLTDNQEALCYIGEEEVIINRIYDTIHVQGVKKWQNMKEDAPKPAGTVYLFYSSRYDDSKRKPDNFETASEETKATYEGTYEHTNLEQPDQLSFKFKDGDKLKEYPKYDEFGSVYTYEIGELITDANSQVMPLTIMKGVSEGNNVLVNIFDPEKANNRKITVKKEWDLNGQQIDKENKPYAKFHIYRMECNYKEEGKFPDAKDIDYEKVIRTWNIDTSNIDTELANAAKSNNSGVVVELVETFTMKYDETPREFDNLSIYAPSGKAYIYFVVEDKEYASSYEITNTGAGTNATVSEETGYKVSDNVVIVSNQGVVLEKNNDNNKKAGVTFKNQLKINTFSQITGTIKWVEGVTNLKKQARPSIAEGKCPAITFTLKRYSTTQPDLDTGNQLASETIGNIDVTWEQDSTNLDIWKYTITSSDGAGFKMYASNGNPYTYMVTESFPTSYSQGSDSVNSKMNLNYYITANNRTRKTTGVSTNGNETVLTFDSINNVLRGTYEVQKSWIDGLDSYGLRPNRVLMMYQYKDEDKWKPLTYDTSDSKKGKIITVEVTKESGWKKSLSQFPRQTVDGSKSFTYRVVEIGMGYDSIDENGNKQTKWVATTDISLNDYSEEAGLSDTNSLTTNGWDFKDVNYSANPTEEISDFGSKNTYGSYRVLYKEGINGHNFDDSETNRIKITNQLDKSLTLTVVKNWEDDNNSFGVRPDYMKFQIQSKICKDSNQVEVADAEWKKVSDIIVRKNNFDDGSGNTNTWTKTFTNLPQFDEDENTLIYRVLEYGISTDDLTEVLLLDTDANTNLNDAVNMTVNGYQMTAYQYDVDLSKVTITNTLKPAKTLEVSKKWLLGESPANKDESADNETAKTNDYSATVIASATYQRNGGNDTKILESKVVLDGSNNYKKTWDKIPSFIITQEETNGQKTTVKWDFVSVSVKEKAVKQGAEAVTVQYDCKNNNGQDIGRYQNGGKDWMVETQYNETETKMECTIVNSPFTSHTLKVNYDEDEDQNSNFHTRPTNVNAKLQYRYHSETPSEWNNITKDSAFYKSLLAGLKYEDLTPTNDTKSENDNYQITVSDLPVYVYENGQWNYCEYRMIETNTSYENAPDIAVKYDDEKKKSADLQVSKIDPADADTTYKSDRSVGGYMYSYKDKDNYGGNATTYPQIDTTTYLTKKLLKVKVTGEKVWDDQSDKYKTRPALQTGTQHDTSNIQVSIYKGNSNTPVDTSITWSKGSSDEKWMYTTETILPKYASGTQELETYTVKETKNVSGYQESYHETDSTKNKATLADFATVTKEDATYQVSDITNKMEKQSLTAKKVWEKKEICDKLGITQKSATFTVQRKVGDTGTYQDVMYREGNDTKSLTVTLNYPESSTVAAAENAITEDSLSLKDLPKQDASGNTYHYRLLETAVAVSMKDTSGSDQDVTFSLTKEDSGDYLVKQKIGETGESDFTAGTRTISEDTLSGESYSYRLGIFEASYQETAGKLEFKNQLQTAQAKANVEWKETLVGSSEIDTTLVKNFRPDLLGLVLQRKATDAAVWEDVPIDATNQKTSLATNVSKESNIIQLEPEEGKNLPIYVLKNGQLTTYQYRIVETDFQYTANGNSSSKTLNYVTDNTHNTGTDNTHDFGTDHKLHCNDLEDGKTFYQGEHENDQNDWTFTTNILNTLQTANLNSQVKTTLTGKITWLDNKNQLGKRPNTEGILMVLRAQKETTKEDIGTAQFKLGNGSDSSTENSFVSPITDITTNAKITWNKTDANNPVWNYQIADLPCYDTTGHYLTYSVCQANNGVPDDYQGEADKYPVNNTLQVIDADKKYAFGTVTDLVNDYSENGKKVENVDFVENLNTKISITKTWKEGNHKYWETRPDLEMFLQHRVVTGYTDNTVTKVDSTDNPDGWTSEVEFSSDKAVRESDNKNYFVLKQNNVIISEDKQTYSFEKVLPQYRITDDRNQFELLQYRAVEIGKEAISDDGSVTRDVLLEEPSEEVKNNQPITRTGTDHVGSYYLKDYQVGWNKGYSTVAITNCLDMREDIVVKKQWNATANEENVKVKLRGVVTNNITTQETVFHETLNAGNAWEFTYKDLPKYDLNFNEVQWSVQEVQVAQDEVTETSLVNGGKAGIVDGKWLATYSREVEEINTPGENDKIIFTVTNTPTTSAKLTVTYKDDLEDKYQTRASNTHGQLQYREKGTGTWSKVSGDLANLIKGKAQEGFKATIVGDVITEVYQEKEKPSSGNQYVYEFNNLPKFQKIEEDFKELEYRIVEVTQGNLSVSYEDSFIEDMKQLSLNETPAGDSSSGGYSYGYNYTSNPSEATLEKELLKISLQGQKLWVDSDNGYQTRPELSAGNPISRLFNLARTVEKVQDSASIVKVIVKESGITGLEANQPQITWKEEDGTANTWKYETHMLPKYKSQKDDIASYQIEETCSNPDYYVTYGTNGETASTKTASIVTDNGDTVYKMSDITNTLQKLLIKKTDKTSNTPLSGVTFKLIKKATNEEVARGTTDANGELSFKLTEAGTYLLEEVKHPGYEQITKELTFTEQEVHSTQVISLENTRILGTLTIHKKDGDTNQGIDGVQFGLYRKVEGRTFFDKIWYFLTGNQYKSYVKVGESTTGTTIIEEIPWGEYYIVEERADGYQLSSNQYYFTVNAATVDSPIQLQLDSADVAGNVITNYKNRFTFQKQSYHNGEILHGGKYQLIRIKSDNSREVVKEFSIGDGETSVSIQGMLAGSYVVKEIEAPNNHALSDREVALYITEQGEILKTRAGEAWASNQVIMKDMPLCNLKITKQFENDDDVLKTFRPSKVKVQLYSYENPDFTGSKTAVGSVREFAVDKKQNTFTYTFTDLPMYTQDGSTRLYYQAEEVDQDPIYEVTYTKPTANSTEAPGIVYEETIKNKITSIENYYVTKLYDSNIPQAAEFTFDVKIGKDNGHLRDYRDKYMVGTYEDSTGNLNNTGDVKEVSPTTPITLKRGETFSIKLPQGAVCQVTEVFENTQNPEYQMTQEAVTNNHLIVTNKKIVYTKIENVTVNETTDAASSQKDTNAGGEVAVLKSDGSGSDEEKDSDEVAYKNDKYGVRWTPMDNWAIAPDLKIHYREFSGDDRGIGTTIEVNGYLDENGNINTSKLNPIKGRYDKFEMTKNGDTITLKLADSVLGMPYLNHVEVKFLPTIAIINTTENQVGGQVKCETGEYQDNSDGKGEHNERRYVDKTIVYAKAQDGYCIDLHDIVIDNVGEVSVHQTSQTRGILDEINPFAALPVRAAGGILLDESKNFTTDISYTMAGVNSNYTISGKVIVEEYDGNHNPKTVKMELDNLPIPLDVGVSFIPSVASPSTGKPSGDASAADAQADSDAALTEEQKALLLKEKNKLANQTTAGAPQTGDNHHLFGWIALLFTGTAFTMLMRFLEKRKRK